MTTDFYNLLLSDCGLAVVLLGLFWYLEHISRGLRGIALWGAAHLTYSLGAAMLDGTTRQLENLGDWHSAFWVAGTGYGGAMIRDCTETPKRRAVRILVVNAKLRFRIPWG